MVSSLDDLAQKFALKKPTAAELKKQRRKAISPLIKAKMAGRGQRDNNIPMFGNRLHSYLSGYRRPENQKLDSD